ncbi:MAG: hypothetical protein RLZZ275_961 [Bacteroidota bacterium]
MDRFWCVEYTYEPRLFVDLICFYTKSEILDLGLPAAWRRLKAKKKSPGMTGGRKRLRRSRVANGARTHDPWNHNPVL